jgi:GntR family transcriptional regulator/MocR family aminotransferase
MRQHTPGAQAIAEYAMHPGNVPWALTFGYGVIDADEIGRALRRLRRAMPS